ncbi:MAG TPA: alpha-ketoacid dehydrogenase subunit beta [Methanomassiliicoccales archaeon]|nr:alpha-ketoacid dehydrogenase subunit beta [Methanomassiliicoccales archaeon]
MTRTITYMEAIREAIREEMQRDPHLFMIGEDVGPYGGEMGLSKGLWEEFGDLRIRDAPISEAAIVGCALGAAATGCRAIAEIPFMDFIGVAMDQIYNQAAKIRYMFGGKARIPLVIRTPIGGYQSAAAQHSQCLEAWFTHTPGIKVVLPSTPYEAKGLMKTALADSNPVLFIEHKKLYQRKGEVPIGDYSIPFGKADVKRRGKHVTVVATSFTVEMALEASATLAGEGIEVEVVDPRTLVPLDEETILESVRRTGRLVVVHEAWRRGGTGAEIAALVAEKAFNALRAPILRVAAENVPIPFSPVLERFVLPDSEKIVQAVRRVSA